MLDPHDIKIMLFLHLANAFYMVVKSITILSLQILKKKVQHFEHNQLMMETGSSLKY